jgi:hypothetical protein
MPKDHPHQHIDLAMNLVLDYLESHSDAADTFDGITQWWLGAAGATISPPALRKALLRLVAAGILRTRRLPGGETLWYALDPRREGGGSVQ